MAKPGAFGILGWLSVSLAFGFTQTQAGEDIDLEELSLKRIMELEVTSVSKRSQKLRDVPTSIYVINEEDIRRSGATRLQDLLKLAPGFWLSEASYTISSAGLREGATAFTTTVAWILDGVPITDNVTGGLFFNSLDLPLEDIERIEVIKGSGGTIYGANSATGIVSIFTKSGEAAEGLKTSLAGGTQNYLAPYVRYGLEARENLFLTFWGRFKTHEGYDRNPLFSGDSLMAPIAGGGEVKVANQFPDPDDNQSGFSGGLKWEFQPEDEWKWSGRFTQSHMRDGQYSIQRFPWSASPPTDPTTPPKRPDSLFVKRERLEQTLVQARLDAGSDPENAYFAQAYHWRYRYDVATSSGIQTGYDITEIEAHKNALLAERHHLSVGANARRVQYAFSDIREDGSVFVANPDNLVHLFGAFLQDEILLGHRWSATIGAKAETWTLIGLRPEILPSLRLVYKPSEQTTWWAAASRSITTPSYSQSDLEIRQAQIPPEWVLSQDPRFQGPAPAAGHWVALVPGENTEPVNYYSLEAGHRGSHEIKIQWDVSAFYNWVRGQSGLTPVDATLQTLIPSKAHPPDSIVPLYYGNLEDYETFGGETVVRVLPWDWLRLELSHSVFYMHGFQGRKIPGDAQGRIFQKPEGHDSRTPNHVGRAKVFSDLPFGFGLSLNGLVSSPFSRGEAFDYAEQLPASQEQVPGGAIITDPPATQFQLDFSLQRRFLRDQLTITVWGRNVFADPYVETFNQYGWASFPHQIHRTFGTGITYQY